MFSYSGDPRTSKKDEVRFLIGDTSQKDPLLQDAEIAYLLGLYSQSSLNAAIRACEMIIAKFSRQADETVGRVSISFSQRAKAYMETMNMLRARLSMEDCKPYAGGISVSDKVTRTENSDRVAPDFSKHMMENQQIAPWTTQKFSNLFSTLEQD